MKTLIQTVLRATALVLLFSSLSLADPGTKKPSLLEQLRKRRAAGVEEPSGFSKIPHYDFASGSRPKIDPISTRAIDPVRSVEAVGEIEIKAFRVSPELSCEKAIVFINAGVSSTQDALKSCDFSSAEMNLDAVKTRVIDAVSSDRNCHDKIPHAKIRMLQQKVDTRAGMFGVPNSKIQSLENEYRRLASMGFERSRSFKQDVLNLRKKINPLYQNSLSGCGQAGSQRLKALLAKVDKIQISGVRGGDVASAENTYRSFAPVQRTKSIVKREEPAKAKKLYEGLAALLFTPKPKAKPAVEKPAPTKERQLTFDPPVPQKE